MTNIIDISYLKNLYECDYTIPHPNSARYLIGAFTWSTSPQGEQHWLGIYRWLNGENDCKNCLAPTPEDWEFLKSLLPRVTPNDPFLLAKKNMKYIDEANSCK